MTEPYPSPDGLSDEELYEEYQHAKQNGPVFRIDELQREICARWEVYAEHAIGVGQ